MSVVAKVDLYSQRFSADCMRVKGLLDRKKVGYSEFLIDEDDDSREVMIKRSGGNESVPQIFINGRAIGGVEQLEALDAAGQLDLLLAKRPRDFTAEDGKAPGKAAAPPQAAPPRQGLFSRFFRP